MTEESTLSATLVLKTKAVGSSEVKHKKIQPELNLEIRKKALNWPRTACFVEGESWAVAEKKIMHDLMGNGNKSATYFSSYLNMSWRGSWGGSKVLFITLEMF